VRVLLACLLALSLSSTRAEAAIAYTGVNATGFNNVAFTLTFGAAPAASDCILVAATIASSSITLVLDSTPDNAVENELHNGPHGAHRVYIWSVPGNGSDTTITVTPSSGGANMRAVAAAFSGANCGTEDGTSVSAGTSNVQTHSAGSITLAAGSLMFGIGTCTDNTCDWTPASGFTSIPSGNGEVETITQAGYQISAGGGSTTFNPATVAQTRDAIVGAAAITASGGGGGATPCVVGAGLICGASQ
jgi:hypothetical protein